MEMVHGMYSSPAPTSEQIMFKIVDGVQEKLLAANAAGCDAFVQGTTFNTDGANYNEQIMESCYLS